MIESEAKLRWCPFAVSRAVQAQSGDNTISMGCFHREDGKGVNLMCIGSECMAWRWFDAEKMFIGIEDGESVYQKRDERNGYCGLAGVPIR